jgi:flavin-dependent dehydrogenase
VLSVALVEASGYEEPRVGESLPPAAGRVLEHLDVAELVKRLGDEPSHGTAAAWGGLALQDNDFLYAARGPGWHLDRPAFEAALAAEAERRGVHVRRRTSVRELARESGAWRIKLSSGGELRAQLAVDATGRAATIARRCGARSAACDRLVSFARFFTDECGDPRTIVEACEGGWWYTAGLPRGRRVVACLTDADLARRRRLHDVARWSAELAGTTHVAARVSGAVPIGPLTARATESRLLEPAAGPGWLAVGDAASMFDPLSSQGITKAMRSGVFASYAIADSVLRRDDDGLARYRRFVRGEFEGYRAARARYYSLEQRWPTSEFWRRRQ